MKYKDVKVPIGERVQDLLGKLTIEEKIAQMACLRYSRNDPESLEKISKTCPGHIVMSMENISLDGIADMTDEVLRSVMECSENKIPPFVHIEAISGAILPGATAFPTAITQASTWNPELIEEMADRIRRQLVSLGIRHALSPVFDIGRDPRWGRLTETYGEDETLSSAMSVAFVGGLQGKNDGDAVVATGKHFVGHGVTEGGLNMGQSNITERELREVHCKPFQAAISKAGLMSVMNSYCAINREAVIASKHVLTELLRDEMGFKGMLVSDYYSIDRLLNPYQYVNNHLDAAILALNAGLDVEYPIDSSYNEALAAAVKEGRVNEALIDRSAARILELKLRLGLFERPFARREEIKVSFCDEGDRLAEKIAKESITLLKNENHLLPLSKDVKRIAVIGPHANRVRSLFGEYTYAGSIDMREDMKNNARMKTWEPAQLQDGVETEGGARGFYQDFPGGIRETPIYVEDIIRKAYPETKTLYETVATYVSGAKVTCEQGISYTGNNLTGYDQALDCASNADVIVLTLGGQNGWGVTATNGEGIDNSWIGLPGAQEQFARDVYALGKKTVVVHIDGRPLSSEYVASHFDAIVECWQLGEKGFDALVSVLFGDVSPSGKLPLTVARSSDRLPAYYGSPRSSGYVTAGKFGVVSNRYGYANATAHPLFYFGHGLSYVEFKYDNLKLEKRNVAADGMLSFSFEITNLGDMDAAEVVQIYISDILATVVRPDRQLVGFQRVELRRGETKVVRFNVEMSQLAFLDEDMKWKVEGGDMKLMIGSSCNDIRVNSEFTVEGDAFIDPVNREFYTLAAK